MTIALVTDSISDLSAAFIAESGITVVPSTIFFNLTEFPDDGQHLGVRQMLEDMPLGKTAVRTAPPTPEAYAQAYYAALARADHIISLHTSAGIAQNIVHARAAARTFGKLVTVLDSRTTSVGQGMQVERLVTEIGRGRSLDEVLDEQRRLAEETQLAFAVDDLRFLRLNGRLGGAAAVLGGMLKVKPILAVQGGKIENVGRTLGHRRAVHVLAETVRQYQRAKGRIRVAFPFSPGGEQTVAEVRYFLAGVPFEDVGNWPLGTAVAANTGPGMAGVALEPV